MSQNAAFALLTSWALRLSGRSGAAFCLPGGMSHCVLGTNRANYHKDPPCRACMRQSRRLYTAADVHWFHLTNPTLNWTPDSKTERG